MIPTQPKRILVFRTGHLGDTVCAIPAFRMIRRHFSNAELTLVCDRPQGGKVALAEVIEPMKIFDRVVTYASRRWFLTPWELVFKTRATKPDLTIILTQVRETPDSVRQKRRFFERCGVPDVRGFLFPTAQHESHPNEPERLVRMLRGVGVKGRKPGYDIPVHPAASAAMDEKLRAAGVNPQLPFMVFCGGGKCATQLWPMERYAEVLPRLAAETRWPVIGLGSRVENERYIAAIRPKFPELKLFSQNLTMPELFELFRRAALYVGNDTGPMHVAAAMNCPVIAILSSRNRPGCWHPDVEPHLVIQARTDCEGCFLERCVKEQHRCMTAITAERVINEAVPFIKNLPVKKLQPCVA